MKLKPGHPALVEARTIHTKRVLPPVVGKILKPVSDNEKVGKGLSVIMKGRWRGMPLYSVTLQERATCPSDCMRWAECYGNGMGFAHRFQHGPELETAIMAELAMLSRMYPAGYAVRLHILGDFYSVGYVEMWEKALRQFPNLNVYGYTARHQGMIADALDRLRILYSARWMVRVSRNHAANHDPNRIYAAMTDTVPGAINCPEQEGKTASCLTCGLCWSTDRTIGFYDHDELNKQRKNNATVSA